VILAALLVLPASAAAAGPEPGTLEYIQRDNRNIADAYGRQTGQQLGNTAYARALQAEHGEVWLQQLAQQAATPTRLAITPGNVFPGWNGGNPLRRGWATCSPRCPARATRTPAGACAGPSRAW
jgi:hypothetical protein